MPPTKLPATFSWSSWSSLLLKLGLGCWRESRGPTPLWRGRPLALIHRTTSVSFPRIAALSSCPPHEGWCSSIFGISVKMKLHQWRQQFAQIASETRWIAFDPRSLHTANLCISKIYIYNYVSFSHLVYMQELVGPVSVLSAVSWLGKTGQSGLSHLAESSWPRWQTLDNLANHAATPGPLQASLRGGWWWPSCGHPAIHQDLAEVPKPQGAKKNLMRMPAHLQN